MPASAVPLVVALVGVLVVCVAVLCVVAVTLSSELAATERDRDHWKREARARMGLEETVRGLLSSYPADETLCD